MVDTFPRTSQTIPESGAPGQTPIVNQMLYLLDAGFPNCVALSASTATPPGGPSNGDTYIIPASGTTGEWVGHEGELVIWLNGWIYLTPKAFWTVRVEDDGDGTQWEYDGISAWRRLIKLGSNASGITASTTQTQGQAPLTNTINEIATVANPNDVVTLPTVRDGIFVLIVNNGANTLQIFPASGDKIDGGATDASVTLATGKRAFYVSLGEVTAEWTSILGA